MRRIAVFVATTSGPVRVERVTRERAPQSMVCLGRTSTVLPISAGYDSFVRRGSGVIERVFGPFEDGAFRLDVSAAIETGESWQLGFFLAHAIVAQPARAELAAEEDADTIVWATGSVDYDLAVGPVGHMAEKLHASAEAMQRWRAAGKAVTMLVRATGADEAVALPSGVRLVPVITARDALAALDLVLPAPGPPAVVSLPVIQKRARPTITPRLAVGFGVAVAVFLIAADWLVPRMAPSPQQKTATATVPAPAPAPLFTARTGEAMPRPELMVAQPQAKLAVVERRAPAGHTCAEVQFGRVPATESPVSASSQGEGTSQLDSLCGLGLVVDNGLQARFVTVMLDVISGSLLFGTERPEALDGRTSFVGRREWAIDLPRRMQKPFEIKATALSADHPMAEIKTADAVAPDGPGVATVRHRVDP